MRSWSSRQAGRRNRNRTVRLPGGHYCFSIRKKAAQRLCLARLFLACGSLSGAVFLIEIFEFRDRERLGEEETLEEFDKIEDEDLSEAEMAYYTEVHARIMGKIASVQ